MPEDAIIVVTSPPKTFEFGIDCMSYDTGEEFRGIHALTEAWLILNYKLHCEYKYVGVSVIPSGLHFVYHSTGMGSRQGFFVHAKKNDILVTSWDPSNEEISITPLISDAAVENLRNGVRRGDLNKNLGPYPLAQHSNWVNLSNMITEAVLVRADVPVGTLVFPGDVEDDAHLHSKDGAIKPYFPGLARVARFTSLDELGSLFTKGMAGVAASEISRMHLDKSAFVSSLVKDNYEGSYEALLGELQLSFVLFMMIFSYPALEHWKRIVNILCQCDDLMINKPTLYAAFLRILYEQLSYSPEDFFHTELSHENFLRPAMTSLFQLLNSDGLPSTLHEHRRRLLMFMRKKFNLFEENAGEEYFNRDAIPVNCLKRGSTMAPSADELYNVVDEDRPVVVCIDEMGDVSAESIQSNSNTLVNTVMIDPKDIEKERFGWRYPALYECVLSGEDMTMAAVRLIESSHADVEDGTSKMSAVKVDRVALLEANLFIENEVPRFVNYAISS